MIWSTNQLKNAKNQSKTFDLIDIGPYSPCSCYWDALQVSLSLLQLEMF